MQKAHCEVRTKSLRFTPPALRRVLALARSIRCRFGAGVAHHRGGAGSEKQRRCAPGQGRRAKGQAELAQSHDAFIPSSPFGSGLPAFPEVGFTGSLPTIWDGTVQSLVFSMPQYQYIQAAQAGVQAAQLSLKDAQEQVALDASADYIELDTVNRELEAAREQEQDAARLVDHRAAARRGRRRSAQCVCCRRN